MIMFLLVRGKHSLENVKVGGMTAFYSWRLVVRKCCRGRGLRVVVVCGADLGEFQFSGLSPGRAHTEVAKARRGRERREVELVRGKSAGSS